MTNPHPITPPPELVQQWYQDADQQLAPYYVFVAHCAAQWAADQELEACCEWVSQWRCLVGGSRPEVGLHASRRPKPPSLKEQLLQKLEHIADKYQGTQKGRNAIDDLRETLEALPE